MRALADADRIHRFMRAFGSAAPAETRVYFTGGATAVLSGWRDSTIDVDLRIVPDASGYTAAHGRDSTMSFCEHCEGQRFDRARVLRALRQVRAGLRPADRRACEAALAGAIQAIKALDIPHLELPGSGDEIVH